MDIAAPLEFDLDDYSGSEQAICAQLTVDFAQAGLRLDVAIASLLPEHSRSRIQGWIRDGALQLDGVVVDDPKRRVNGGEQVLLRAQALGPLAQDLPEEMSLEVVFEDEHILVVNKPAGLVVHPGSGNWHGTLLNGVLAHAPCTAGIPRAGIVHRLDKDTSGLMVVAKTLAAQTDLVRQLQARTVKRHYHAFVMGTPPAQGTVDAPIGRHPTQRVRMAVVQTGREARTHYHVLERFAGASWVECVLDTGRTHQIRVHMTHLGFPLIGDTLYCGRKKPPAAVAGFARQALHAFRLGLIHPASGVEMSWLAPMPADMLELAQTLRHG